jgi:hypothetical protein
MSVSDEWRFVAQYLSLLTMSVSDEWRFVAQYLSLLSECIWSMKVCSSVFVTFDYECIWSMKVCSSVFVTFHLSTVLCLSFIDVRLLAVTPFGVFNLFLSWKRIVHTTLNIYLVYSGCNSRSNWLLSIWIKLDYDLNLPLNFGCLLLSSLFCGYNLNCICVQCLMFYDV